MLVLRVFPPDNVEERSTMNVISLWEPWASAVALGTKKIETRGWHTAYRGPLLIHAAKRRVISELMDLLQEEYWLKALEPLGATADEIIPKLSFGSIIARVDMVGCTRTEDMNWKDFGLYRGRDYNQTAMELDLGNYSPGRYGLFLENPIRFSTPIPWKARQGKIIKVTDQIVLDQVKNLLGESQHAKT